MDFLLTLWSLTCEMAPYLLFGFFVAGMLHAFVPQSLYRRHLGQPGLRSVFNATLLGVPLPLCSCGVIPTTVALRRGGASPGACTAFLIATPQTGVDSILATYSLLGLPFAIIRPMAALVTGLVGGVLTPPHPSPTGEGTSSSPSEAGHGACPSSAHALSARCASGDCACHSSHNTDQSTPDNAGKGWLGVITYGFGELMEDVGRWLAIGLIVAAAITVFVPNDFFVVMQEWPLLNMLLVLVVAIPMYLCATGSIPIALSLMMKGLTPGAAFVMLMAGPAVNAASLLVVGKALGRRQMMSYLCSIVGGAVFFGLLIDYVLPAEWFTYGTATIDPCCAVKDTPWTTTVLTVFFLALLVRALIVRMFGQGHSHDACGEEDACATALLLQVSGMRCSHCAANARQAVEAVPGVESVEVDLPTGRVTVTGHCDRAAVVAAIEQAGYTVESK